MNAILLIDAKDVMLATLTRALFSRENWLYELKYDGYRCLVRKVGARIDLISRQGNLMNQSFPDIVQAVGAVSGDFIWDAELTVDETSGKSSFERPQLRVRTKVEIRVRASLREHSARLYVFDILAVGARDLRALPLFARKEALRDSFENTNTLVYVTGIVGADAWVFEQVETHDFEGMVAKRLDAPYQRGRSNDWQKIKYASYSRPAALGWGRK